jgi:hypothetical protein
VSVAVVKADHAPAVDAVIGAVNIASAGIALINPPAGAVVLTIAVVGGWAWNKWKFDRVRPVLEEVTKRVQSIENDYVRREEFADMLWDALRRLGEQPDPGRRKLLRNIILNTMDEPTDHTENRLFLRLADELSTVELRVFLAVEGAITRDEIMWSNNKILATRAGVGDGDIDLIMSHLAMQRLLDGMKFVTKSPPAGPSFLLTPTGSEFRRYIKG